MGICESAPSHSHPTVQQIHSQQYSKSPSSFESPNHMSIVKIPMQNDSESIVKRVVIILSEYYKLTKNSKHTLIWSDLFGTWYSDEWLINDFNHVLDHFNDDDELEKIHSQLMQRIVDKNDALKNMKEGSILYRHFICDQWSYNNMESVSNLYFQCNDPNDIVRYKLLDKMFAHICSCFLLGLRLTNDELQSIETAATKSNSNPDVDPSLKVLHHILTQKRAIWIQLKTKQWLTKYCDDKFVTHLTPKTNNDEEKENKEEDERVSSNKVGVQLQHTRTANEYSIGTRYYYENWRYYSENYEKLKISETRIIRGNHWQNLKLEMTQNNICKLSIEQWMILQLYCKILYQSKKCKKLKCDILKSDGHGIDIHYGLKQGDLIGLEHIISIYIYCNFPNIKQKFNQHLHDNKYSNFGRLLRETVEGFGISVFSDESDNEFYHNVYVGDSNASSTYFDGYLALKWCNPSVFTTDLSIVHLYNLDNEHITLNCCKYTNNASVNYFACNWLSDCSLDNECLFIGGKHALKLQSIILSHIYNYSHYINAIHVLSSLIKGKSNTLPIDRNVLFAIETLTKNKLKNINDETERKQQHSHDMDAHHDYVMKLFTKFCSNIEIPIYINLIWILDSSANGYKAIRKWIVNEDNSWIRFDVLCNLFPNVSKVKIGHSQFMLKHSTFDTFIAFFDEKNHSDNNRENMRCNKHKHNLEEITFEDPNESIVSVKSIVNKYQQKLNDIGWKIESNKWLTKIYLTKKTSDSLWDDLIL